MKKILPLLLFLALSKSAAADIDRPKAEQVDKLLASDTTLDLKPRISQEEITDNDATLYTAMLGLHNPKWNKNHPKWKEIYTVVRADVASCGKPVVEYVKTQQDIDFKRTIAENLTSTEVDAILNYLATDQGKDYQEFDAKIYKLSFSAPLKNDATQTFVSLSQDQIKDYAYMFKQSRGLRMTALSLFPRITQDDPSFMDDLDSDEGAHADQRSVMEIESLYRKYGREIDGFAAFNQSLPEKHFLMALLKATHFTTQRYFELLQNNKSSMMPYRAKWQALYQQEVADH